MKDRDIYKKRGRDGKKKTENAEIDIISLNLNEEPKRKVRQEEVKRNKKPSKKKKKVSNKEFLRVTYLFVVIFICMMGYLVYFNAVEKKEIINSAYNVRLDSMSDRVVRGKILDRNGNVLAETKVSEDGTEKRVYPYGKLYSHVVGYDSHGKAGLESVENFDLLTSHAFFLEQIMKEVREEKNIGDNVITTLDTNLQQAAYDALGNNKGAVVVMEASTGKILSLVSKPDFDPNTLSDNWDSVSTSEDSVLLNRATQGMYAPGSVFKLVTALTYMRENSDHENYNYECVGEITHENTTIHCANEKVHGQLSLKDSLAYSCNASFSNIGLTLDIDEYQKTASDLLFDSKLPSVLPYTQSKFQLTEESPDYEVMMTAIGQGNTQVSPYHMALVTSAIANGGVLMEPYLVDGIVNYVGDSVEKNMPEKYATIMTSEEAAQLKEYMMAVTEYGTASSLSGQGYSVAGKTGTAEYSSDKDKVHSWFVGFTNVDNPELVISVVIEGADTSGARAVSVAKKVFNAYY